MESFEVVMTLEVVMALVVVVVTTREVMVRGAA